MSSLPVQFAPETPLDEALIVPETPEAHVGLSLVPPLQGVEIEPAPNSILELVEHTDPNIVDRSAVHSRSRTTESGPLPEDLVKIYLNQIDKFPLLTKADEARLAQIMEKGAAAKNKLPTSHSADEKLRLRGDALKGEKAKDQFIKANLLLVVRFAKRYQSKGVPLLDLIQEGNLGLIHAVEKFDWRKGFKFSTYAEWWIKQAINTGMPDNVGGSMRIPQKSKEQMNTLYKWRQILSRDGQHEPSIEELAGASGLKEERIIELLSAPTVNASLDEPVGEDNDTQRGELIADPNSSNDTDQLITDISKSQRLKQLFADTNSANDLDQLFNDILTSQRLKELFADLTPDERKMLALNRGLIDDNTYNYAKLSKMFGISGREVERRMAVINQKLAEVTASASSDTN